jgi:hypothetical protein
MDTQSTVDVCLWTAMRNTGIEEDMYDWLVDVSVALYLAGPDAPPDWADQLAQSMAKTADCRPATLPDGTTPICLGEEQNAGSTVWLHLVIDPGHVLAVTLTCSPGASEYPMAKLRADAEQIAADLLAQFASPQNSSQ